jgi:hypothetical protein
MLITANVSIIRPAPIARRTRLARGARGGILSTDTGSGELMTRI